MYQEFQVLTDTLDTQNLPDIPVEEFFILANLAVDEYMQAARIAFETSRKISDDVAPLVKRGFILPIVDRDRVLFPYNAILVTHPPTIDPGAPELLSAYYFINGYFESTWKLETKDVEGRSELVYYQQDDIVVRDPFKSKFADKVPIVVENNSIVATPTPQLTLNLLVGTFLLQPAKISQVVNCDLAKQVHHTIVKRSVELALENIESIRQKTFNQ